MYTSKQYFYNSLNLEAEAKLTSTNFTDKNILKNLRFLDI